LLLVQRYAQVDLHLAARLDVIVHLRLEEGIALPAVGLGAIEREIGVLHELVGVRPVARRQRHADAGADIDALAADLVGSADGLDDAGGERLGGFAIAYLGLADGELVAAEARHHVALAPGAEPARAG